MKKIVLIGGGHSNCQIIKLLKEYEDKNEGKIQLPLVSESDVSFYSGMLPATVAGLYP